MCAVISEYSLWAEQQPESVKVTDTFDNTEANQGGNTVAYVQGPHPIPPVSVELAGNLGRQTGRAAERQTGRAAVKERDLALNKYKK
ncbi:Hypothetical predicted protein [Scomber scombrus]|uniref:Uncharacterized protein n=1 Tax=Scomber scombrus TaxID=13677 RepID=A0AAV1Q4S5_SCOSC